MHELTVHQWTLAAIAALGVGVSKAGFPGMALLHVMIFAFLFGARDSTGIVLPMLILGDLGAIGGFYRHTRWYHLRRTLPAAGVGVVLGTVLMGRLSDSAFAPVLGWIILTLVVLHVVGTEPFSATRASKGSEDRSFEASSGSAGEYLPETFSSRWSRMVAKGAVPTGLLAGITTMLANAGGPVLYLYLLGTHVPKLELTATVAWFFFVLNVFKVPFSAGLGLITRETLALNLILVPGIVIGLLVGRWLVHKVPQRLFNQLLLAFAAVAALRLIGVF
jgi:uncharacterized membrane protein YfcA